MGQEQLYKLVGMLAEIAYEIHDKEGINEKLSEMLLDLWREFSCYK